MKLPNSIKIGPINYRIVRVPKEQIENGSAEIDPDEGVIRVRKRARVDNVKEWILHECLHGCHKNAGKYDNELRADEAWIEATTPTLLQIIIDNPHLISFLQHTPEKKASRLEGLRKPEVQRLPAGPAVPEL